MLEIAKKKTTLMKNNHSKHEINLMLVKLFYEIIPIKKSYSQKNFLVQKRYKLKALLQWSEIRICLY